MEKMQESEQRRLESEIKSKEESIVVNQDEFTGNHNAAGGCQVKKDDPNIAILDEKKCKEIDEFIQDIQRE
jgi:hypothetical protein